MQKTVEAKTFWLFAKEVILKVLQNLDARAKTFKNLGDFDGVKKIEEELIPKYEKLFQELSLDLDSQINSEKIDNLKNIIFDIMEQFNLDKDYIESELEKRKNFKKNSGSEVVKNLFEYQLEELSKKRNSLLELMETMIQKEEELNTKLMEAVQEEDEQRYLEELTSTSKKINILSEKLIILKEKIDSLHYSLKTKWRYEIFGTLSKEEMLKAYKENDEGR